MKGILLRTKELTNEVFALRNLEEVELIDGPLEHPASWLAVRIVPVSLPGVPVAPYRGNPNNDMPEHCAVVAAGHDHAGRWQWVALSLATKEYICDFLVDDVKCDRDKWYYLRVGQHRKEE